MSRPTAPWPPRGPGRLTVSVGVRSLLVGHDTGCGIIDLPGEKEGEGEGEGSVSLLAGVWPPRSCSALFLHGHTEGAGGWEEGPGQSLLPAWPPTVACPPPRPPLSTLLPPQLQGALATTAPSPRLRHHVRPAGSCPSRAAPTNQAPVSLWQPQATGEASWWTLHKVLSAQLTYWPPRHSVPLLAAEAFPVMGTPLMGVARHSQGQQRVPDGTPREQGRWERGRVGGRQGGGSYLRHLRPSPWRARLGCRKAGGEGLCGRK